MSTLLKALEKAEDERGKSGDDKAAAASGAAAAQEKAGGFKLSGGSKLSSALRDTGQKEKAQAARVMSGYEAGHEDDDIEDVAAIAAGGRIRRFVALAAVAAIAAGGYYAYNEFLAPKGEEQVQEVAAASAETGDVAGFAAPEAIYLPLVEPEYDLQQDIQQAVLSSGEASADLQQANQNEELSRRIAQFTQQLLAESIEEARRRREEERAIQRQRLEEEAELRVSTVETLEERLDNLVSSEGAEDGEDVIAFVAPNDYMLDQLNALSEKPFVQRTRTRNEFIAPAGSQNTDLLAPVQRQIAQAAEGGEEEAKEEESAAGKASAAGSKEPSASITRSEDEHQKVFDDAVASYERGDFEAAENGFRLILSAHPHHVNAMIGLAKVHSSRGNVRIALNTLLRASDLQPGNSLVISELVALQTDSGQQLLGERRLSSMLGNVEERSVEARIHFLLGGIYARQERWFEARDVFSYAHHADGSNPDYAYNLAVVHDFLNNPEKAVEMYRMAAELAKASVSAFDPQVALSRADELAGL